MISTFKHLLRTILPKRVVYALRVLLRGIPQPTSGCALFDYDKKRFYAHSACSGGAGTRTGRRAQIIMDYHIVEKGLTMPTRKMGFGREVLMRLVHRIDDYVSEYGIDDRQVCHAIGVVREYWVSHEDFRKEDEEAGSEYWNMIGEFVSQYPGVAATKQLHFSREDFYSKINAPFPDFAFSRHTVRNYIDKEIPDSEIAEIVKLAGSAPSACNRQHCRSYCIKDRTQIQKLLSLQNGNRGFGHLASCLFVVTADIEDTVWNVERTDVFINGGIYLMNLVYAMHYHKIGNCILNWSCAPEKDIEARKLLSIKPSETIIALVSCGYVPDEFDVCTSLRS